MLIISAAAVRARIAAASKERRLDIEVEWNIRTSKNVKIFKKIGRIQTGMRLAKNIPSVEPGVCHLYCVNKQKP
jgi:hypothetical protein